VDAVLLERLARSARLIVTVEEGTLIGGLGSAVIDQLVDRQISPMPPIRRLGIPDIFLDDYGSQDSLMGACGLQSEQIADAVVDAVGVLSTV
jgi:transketolase